MKKILLIEDNDDIRENTAEILELAHYKVDTAPDGKLGIEAALKNKPDLIICDIMMPVLDGYGVLHMLHKNKETQDTPFIFLSARTERTDIRKGMDTGADDYIIKPFEFRELLMKIRVLLRRTADTNIPMGNLLRAGDLVMNLDTKEVRRNDQLITLTAKEFQLLEYLLRNKNRVVSRADIAINVWDVDFDTNTNIIDVYINYVRNKVDKPFEDKLIHTQVGMGYMLKES